MYHVYFGDVGGKKWKLFMIYKRGEIWVGISCLLSRIRKTLDNTNMFYFCKTRVAKL